MNFELAERLTALRKDRGYSQEALASALNISRQAISKWERGEASPDTDNLIALALLYKVSLDVLVGFSLPEEEKREEAPEPYDVISLEVEAVAVEEPSEVTADTEPEEIEAEETEKDEPIEEAPTDRGFSIENEEYSVYISNGVLTVTPKPKEKQSLFSRLRGIFSKK